LAEGLRIREEAWSRSLAGVAKRQTQRT
jgi:hypothetical protein